MPKAGVPFVAARPSGRGAILSVVLLMLVTAIDGGTGATAAAPLATLKPDAVTRDDANGLVRPVAVFGTDRRKRLTKPNAPLARSVGLLFNNDARTVCTAFCVGDRTIATASHCLYRAPGQGRVSLATFRFSLKAAPGSPTTHLAGHDTGSTAQNVLAGGLRLRIAPPIDASRDWALARLATPICKGHGLVIAAHSSAEIIAKTRAKALTHVSFHRDFGEWDLAEINDCGPDARLNDAARTAIEQDFSAPEHLVLHQCDTGGASSGSPLIVGAGKSRRVVAINVGTYIQTRLMMRDGKVVHRFKADAIANTAVSGAAFIDILERFQRADILTLASDVKALQTGLAALGLYGGAIDGAYGPQTRHAILDFELARGGMATGLATAETLAAVKAGRKNGVPVPSLASQVKIRSSRPSADRLRRRLP